MNFKDTNIPSKTILTLLLCIGIRTYVFLHIICVIPNKSFQVFVIPNTCHIQNLPYPKGKKFAARGDQICEYELNTPSEIISTLFCEYVLMLSFFSVLGCGISAAAASCSQQSTNSSNKSVNNINNNNNQQVANGTTTSALVENHSSRSPTVIRTLASASLASSASTASPASNIR